jgi:thioredoxin 1
MHESQIRELDTETFEAAVLEPGSPVLVEFSAGWCPPCRMIEPVVAELANSLAGRLQVFRLDVDRFPEISARYSVLSMPTLMLFAGGRPADRLVGFASAGHVRRWVDSVLPPRGGSGAGGGPTPS